MRCNEHHRVCRRHRDGRCRVAARLPGLVIALAMTLAMMVATGAGPAGAEQAIDEAVRIVQQHHLFRTDPASLDRKTRETLIASLRRTDHDARWWPQQEGAANRDWTGRGIVGIGASVIDDGSRILFVPISGGPMARQGINRPVLL